MPDLTTKPLITSINVTDIMYLGQSPFGAGDDGRVEIAALAAYFSSGSGGGFEFQFQNSTAGSDPGTGGIRYNSATPASVTEVYISATSLAGLDVSTYLSNASPGTDFIIRQETDGTRSQIFNLDSPAIDNGGWFTLPVSFVSTGTGGRPANNSTVSVAALAENPSLLTSALKDTIVNLVSSSNQIAVDASLGNTHEMANLTENTTFQNPTNAPAAGTTMTINILLTIGSGGPFTVAFGSAYKLSGTVNTAANARNLISIQYNPSTTEWWGAIAQIPA